MNKIYIAACGFALSSVILTSFNQKSEKQSFAATNQKGTLTLVGNGEDFIRQGFVSKDGWHLSFEHVYVSIAQATAYSTKSVFKPQKGDQKKDIEYQDKIDFLETEQTIDLVAEDNNANSIEISQVQAPVNFYNALAWSLSTASMTSPASGNTILLKGVANKDGQAINFKIGLNTPTEYICGEYIGDERLGIVEVSSPGKVEVTLHFDHIFGDFDTPPEDALNQAALGFQPLAELAQKGSLELNDDNMFRQLSSKNHQLLTQAVLGLGHVGEGHCLANSR